MAIRNLAPEFINTFGNIFNSISENSDIPTVIIKHRMLELLLWLAQRDVKFILNDGNGLRKSAPLLGQRSTQDMVRF